MLFEEHLMCEELYWFHVNLIFFVFISGKSGRGGKDNKSQQIRCETSDVQFQQQF